MSLSKKEQFIHMDIEEIPIREDNSFDYSYGYLEKGKIYTKKITLILLGKSLNTDMVINYPNCIQCVATDTMGEIYEVVLRGKSVVAIRDMKSIYKPNKKKKDEEEEEEE